MSDLRLIVDDAEGLRVALTGAYEGWTPNSVEWHQLEQDKEILVATGLYGTDLLQEGAHLRITVEVTSPKGVTETLSNAVIFAGQYQENFSGQPFRYVELTAESNVVIEVGEIELRNGSVSYPVGPFAYSAEV